MRFHARARPNWNVVLSLGEILSLGETLAAESAVNMAVVATGAAPRVALPLALATGERREKPAG